MKMLPILIVSANIIFTIISVLIYVLLNRSKNGRMKAYYFTRIICFFSIVMLMSGFTWLAINGASYLSYYGVNTDMMAFSMLSCIIPFLVMIIISISNGSFRGSGFQFSDSRFSNSDSGSRFSNSDMSVLYTSSDPNSSNGFSNF